MYNSVIFSIFTKLYNHHHYLTPEHFPYLRKKPHSHYQPVPIPQTQPLATTNLLSVSVNLSSVNISFKWNHMMNTLLYLVSLKIKKSQF